MVTEYFNFCEAVIFTTNLKVEYEVCFLPSMVAHKYSPSVPEADREL